MYKTPVLVILFNRPELIDNQVRVLKKIKPEQIYLALDAPGEGQEEDIVKCKRVHQTYTRAIDWNAEVRVLQQEENRGPSLGPVMAMRWFFKQEREGIILEDDILPDESFFRFASRMLDRFRNEKDIISISGCNLGFQGPENAYLTGRIMNMWGWATWADRFRKLDFTISTWKTVKRKEWFLYNRLRNHLLDLDINWWRYWMEIFNRTAGKPLEELDYWDYQFIYNQLYNKQKTIYPAQNLVRNVGFHSSAVHTKDPDNPASKLKTGKIRFPVNKLPHRDSIQFEEQFLKPVWALYKRPNLNYYLGNFLKKNHLY